MTDTNQKSFSRRSFAAMLILIAAFALGLHLEGRPLVCKHGFGIWASAFTHCVSQNLFDSYTLSHVLHGVIFFWLLVPLAGRVSLRWRLFAATVIEIGWELIENSPWIIDHYRNNTASLDYAGDSLVNSLCDVLSCGLGFLFASRTSWKTAIATFIALELLALYMARDNLTLNVLMFFLPLDGIKEWQMQGMQ